jgi:predicted HTH domain antitoxin
VPEKAKSWSHRATRPPQSGAAGYRLDADRGILEDMSSVAIDIPEATLVALKLDAAKAAAELRMAAAMKLFELGRLSSGAAAELAGVPRVAFLAKLSEFGVDTFQHTPADLASDLANA